MNCKEIDKIMDQMGAKTLDEKKILLHKEKARRHRLLDKQNYKEKVFKDAIAKLQVHPAGARAGLKALVQPDITGQVNWPNLDRESVIIENLWKQDAINVYTELEGMWLFGGQLQSKATKKLETDVQAEIAGFETGNTKAQKIAQEITQIKEKVRLDLEEHFVEPYDPGLSREFFTQDPDTAKRLLKDTLADPSTADQVLKEITESLEVYEKVDMNQIQFRDKEALYEFSQAQGINTLSDLETYLTRNAQLLADAKIIGGAHNFKRLNKIATKLQDESGHAGTVLKLRTGEMFMDAQYRVASGEVDKLGEGSPTLAKFGSVTRAMNIIGVLGNVIWSSVGDPGSVNFANVQVGVKRSTSYGAQFRSLFGNSTERQLAEWGYGIEHLHTQITNRFSEDDFGLGKVNKTKNFIMFWSGIGYWSRSLKSAGKKVQHLNLQNRIKDALETGKTDKYLDFMNWTMKDVEEYRDMDWDTFASWPKEKKLKVIRTVDKQSTSGILEPGSATRTMTTSGAKKGTIQGESVRFFTMVTSWLFESFNKYVLNEFTHKKSGTLANHILLRAEQAAVMTVLGSVGYEAYNVIKNKTPEIGSPLNPGNDEDQLRYWGKALMKFGPHAQVLENLNRMNPWRERRYNKGRTYGMAIDTMFDLGSAMVDDISDVVNPGKKPRYDRSAAIMLRSYNPLNIWSTRALSDIYIVDSIRSMLNPNYESYKRKQARRRKKYGQEQLIDF